MTEQERKEIEHRIEDAMRKPYALRTAWFPAWAFDRELDIGDTDEALPGMEVIDIMYGRKPRWAFWARKKKIGYKFREKETKK